ncbi:DeoR family transcriptional regulator [Spiroplasma citri]|uniref:DeoR family transcriptional regulator n=1 Tax=Spiroplasma citri TaxID=2133 RepID=A0AAX3SY77_SPICI|nr:DeoR family transcriptional regulator [Spiroplasma citri]WFG96112.1 DeoR family transcriptional regulator [Spiroplasma citri]WFG99997.1 DeoR family transcriptional regulator [Spiroplasma citri]
MLKKLRWEKILACLDDQQLVLINDLITHLQLSPTTLRRDLTEME